MSISDAISTDTLCDMRDVKALHALLKEIVSSGFGGHYTVWLLDLDHFKQINSAITHEGANEKLILMSKILKRLESKTKNEWNNMGIQVDRIWCFRQW